MTLVFKAAKREGVPCSLETPMEGNARDYVQRGFKIVGDTQVPDSSVYVWLIRREIGD